MALHDEPGLTFAARQLDPGTRMGELLFGLIMTERLPGDTFAVCQAWRGHGGIRGVEMNSREIPPPQLQWRIRALAQVGDQFQPDLSNSLQPWGPTDQRKRHRGASL